MKTTASDSRTLLRRASELLAHRSHQQTWVKFSTEDVHVTPASRSAFHAAAVKAVLYFRV